MTYKVPFPKKSTFLGKVPAQTFSEQIANLHPELKKCFFWQFYMKAEDQRILEHPGLTL